MLDILLSLAQTPVEVRPDPGRLRPSDVEILIGDCTRFQQLSGWTPTIPFDVTLKDLLDYWRRRV
jgi:GDP-4-dehydro-6-deoxy-D-mannose reductase